MTSLALKRNIARDFSHNLRSTEMTLIPRTYSKCSFKILVVVMILEICFSVICSEVKWTVVLIWGLAEATLMKRLEGIFKIIYLAVGAHKRFLGCQEVQPSSTQLPLVEEEWEWGEIHLWGSNKIEKEGADLKSTCIGTHADKIHKKISLSKFTKSKNSTYCLLEIIIVYDQGAQSCYRF